MWDSCRPISLPEPEATKLPHPRFPPSSFSLCCSDAFCCGPRCSARRWDLSCRGKGCRGCEALPGLSHPPCAALGPPLCFLGSAASQCGTGGARGSRWLQPNPTSFFTLDRAPALGLPNADGAGGGGFAFPAPFVRCSWRCGSAAVPAGGPAAAAPCRAVPSARLSAGGSPRSTARRGPGAAPERPERSGNGGVAGLGRRGRERRSGNKRRWKQTAVSGGAGRGRAAPCGSARAAAAARPLPARRRRLKGRRERGAPPASAEGRERRASACGPDGRGRCPFKARAADAGGFIYMGARGCHVTEGAAAPGGG